MSNKSGVGDNVISLPQGGGAQKGLGESFSPDLFTGTGNFSVPIAVPAGRNGFQPQLNLGYSTGNGNSAFGMGWGISVPGIMRKTNKGIPIYDDEQDTFVLSGAEDLVLVEKQSETVDSITHHSRKYRPRTEGLFARIIHHQYSDGRDFWEVRSKDGLVSWYGDAEGISDEYHLNDPEVDDNIFAWKLSKTEDPFQNSIQYRYQKVNIDNKEHTAVQQYLTSIQYMNYDDGGSEAFLCSVQFQYEDRPDAFSEGRAGFEVRTSLRCTAIETYTHPKDEDLPDGYVADPAGNKILVKKYDLKYRDELEKLPLNGASVLAEIQVSGYDADTDEWESMPPLSFGYTEFEPQSRDFFPLEGKALPVQSLSTAELELADLDGNGLPDFIEMNGQTVRYWKNEGNGKFAQPQLMKEAPAFSLADPDVQLMDADGDGRIDLVVSKEGINAYFPLNHEGKWDSKGIKRYKTAPTFSFADPEVKLLDLDGDGITDVLRSGSRFENYYQKSHSTERSRSESQGGKAEGWGKLTLSNRKDFNSFPNVSFSNPKIKLADMNGDGLQDIVQVENGSVLYWPNLGHGKWGKCRVMMKNAVTLSGAETDSTFLFPQNWNPSRVILGDVIGNGTADLMYVEDGEVHLWINQSGNRWSEKITIKGTPAVYHEDAVRLVDLLGSGVAGLLFTYNLGEGGLANQQHYFLDFTAGTKPYVMNSMNNNMGALTRVTYESSIHSWMRDNTNNFTPLSEAEVSEVEVSGVEGQQKIPWKTSLPFPVQVVTKTEVIDEISKGKLVTQYRYSHGYWDGYEREFRGFGRVEQQDTESFVHYNSNALNKFQTVEATHYSPPTKTVNWFHLGGINNADSGAKERFYEADFSDEYWEGDPAVLKMTAATSQFLHSLEPRDKRDAYRAWRGSTLRTELYAADADGSFTSDLARKPFTVNESSFGIRLEGRGIDPFTAPSEVEMQTPILFSFLEASRSTNWERGNEPKSTFSFSADYDAYGQATQQINMAVPRGKDPLSGQQLSGTPEGKQHTGGYLTTLAVSEFIHKDEAVTYICDRMSEQKSYEIINEGNESVFSLRDRILANTATRKVIAHQLMYYDGLAYTGLPLGSIGTYGVVSRTERLYSTNTDINAAYPELPEIFSGTPDLAEYPSVFDELWNNNRAGFEQKTAAPYENGFYVPGDLKRYDFQEASGSYGSITGMRDVFQEEAIVTFDTYAFLPLTVTNPLQMQTSASYDYRTLQARLVTDANDNQTAFAFSPLGLLTATAVMGKSGENEGDTLANPGTTMEYDFHAFYTQRQPVWVKTVKRAFHINDPADTGETYTAVEYSDGFGRLLQSRNQANDILYQSRKKPNGDSGLPANQTVANAKLTGIKKAAQEPDNVVVNGFKVYNNKGKVVEQFEPYYDSDYLFKPANKVEKREFIEKLGLAVEAFINQYSAADLNNESLLGTFLESRLKLGYSTAAYIELLTKHKIIFNTLEMNNAEKIEIPDADQWHFGTGDFTVEFRVRYDQNINALVGNQTQQAVKSSGFWTFMGDRRLYLGVGDGTNVANLRQNHYLEPGSWYHLVGVKETTNPGNWKIYQDGALDTQVYVHSYHVGIDSNAAPVGPLEIGERINAKWLDGSIRDVRIYNRALSAQEVADNYNAGAGNPPAIRSDLVLNMPIDEGTGTSIKDYSEYGESGTLSGVSYQWLHHLNAGWRDELPEEMQKVRLFYDALGRPVQSLNPDGTASINVYGIPATLGAPALGAGGRFSLDYTATPWEQYAYDANDLGGDTHPVESVAYSNHWNTPESSETDALGRTIVTRQRLDQTASNDVVMQYAYDIQGRLSSVTDPEGRLNFQYKYPTTAVNASKEGETPEAEALQINHLDSGVRTQVFDARGAFIEGKDVKGTHSMVAYNELGQVLKVWAIENGQDIRLLESYDYGDATLKAGNAFGKLIEQRDGAGLLSLHDYDFKGNLLEKEFRAISDNYLEDAERFLLDWEGGDLNNEMVFASSFEFDALNRPVLLKLPEDVNGYRKTIVPGYSRSGALEKLSMDGVDYVKELAYNARGQRLFIAFGNGVMNRYTYDVQNFRLLRMKAEKYTLSDTSIERNYAYQSGTCRQDLGYTYDLNGNILKKKNRTPDCGIEGTALGKDALENEYAYDAINRLLSATGRESDTQGESYRWTDAPIAGSPNASHTQAYTRQYTYDKVGNIKSLQQIGSNAFTRTFDYPELTATSKNVLQKISVSSVDTNFSYDEKGNLSQSGSTRFYEWNEKDQLAFFKIDAGSGPSVYAHYLYDASGNRAKKIVWDQQGNKEVTVYVDGIFEYRLKQEDSTDKEQNIIHIMDDTRSIAQTRVGQSFNDDIEVTSFYILDDHLGSSNTRLNSDGAIIDHQEYYPFGSVSLRTYSSKRYQYCGKEKDSESGLVYYGARYYAPWLCRFISVDPLASKYKQLTPYQNAGNDPIGDYDIDGMQSAKTPEDGAGERTYDSDEVRGRAWTEQGLSPAPPSPHNVNFSNENERNVYTERVDKAIDNLELIKNVFEVVADAASNLPGISFLLSPFKQFVKETTKKVGTELVEQGSKKADDIVETVAKRSDDMVETAAKKSDEIIETTVREIDHTFIEGVDNLSGKIDLGWYDGNTAYAEISAILKSQGSESNKAFSNLVNKMEELAKTNKLSEVRIEFKLVVNPKLAKDDGWARKYGYHFSSNIDKFGTNVTWTKFLE